MLERHRALLAGRRAADRPGWRSWRWRWRRGGELRLRARAAVAPRRVLVVEGAAARAADPGEVAGGQIIPLRLQSLALAPTADKLPSRLHLLQLVAIIVEPLALRVEAQAAAVAREADAARVDADVPAARAAPRDARGGVQGVQPVGLDGFELQGWEVEEVRWRR